MCSAPYTPEQNGTAERLNRTLMEMVRSMLDEARLRRSFWAEALAMATELRNITATNANDNKTPIECLTARKPNVKHRRIFGTEAWIRVAKGLRMKLEPKAKRRIVLRSLSYGKYRVWDTEARRTYDSRHVFINENIFPACEWRANETNNAAMQKWYSDFPSKH